MNRSCCHIGPRQSAGGPGCRRQSRTLLPAAKTQLLGGRFVLDAGVRREDLVLRHRVVSSSFSREHLADGLVNTPGRSEALGSMTVVGKTGMNVEDTAAQKRAVARAGKTVILGTLAALSVGMMQASPSQVPFASVALAIPAVSAEALTTAFRSAWAGLAAGCLHTLAGADHLAALTPLTIGQSHLRASMLGALWGFGHSTGQLLLGLAMVLLKDRFSEIVPAITKWGGAIVGLTLVAIGVLGVYESYFEGGHDHGHHHHHHNHHHHHHGDSQDSSSSGQSADATKPKKKTSLGSSLATFATGIIYGLQPDALFVIIPALALPTKLAATAFIIAFVLGTVGAMGAYAGVIGATSQAVAKSKNQWMTNNLSGAASAVAILIGSGILLGSCGIQTPLAIA